MQTRLCIGGQFVDGPARGTIEVVNPAEEHADELARLESLDTGHPIRDSSRLDVPRTAAAYRYFGGMAGKYQGSAVPVEAGYLNYVLREPVCVAGREGGVRPAGTRSRCGGWP